MRERPRSRKTRLSRQLRRAGLGSAGAIALTAGLAALPAAAATQSCTVTVTVLGGAHLTFVMNVPTGTPLSSLSLPTTLPVLGVSESCAPPAGTTTGTSSTQSTQSSTSTKTGSVSVATTVTNTSAPKVARPNAQKRSASKTATGRSTKPALTGGTSPAAALKKASGLGQLRGAGGVPSVSNPTFSFALPGPAAVGVPNFFIDSFRIPPFLLPIYQAAGIEYSVPWQVLAAINEIETDYGRNLSISSAGAVGWMQFLPSTWKRWGVAATGDGIADPYNPVDAIFTAARYLHAAGASQNLGRAVFAYNHAGWYVQSVLLRARLIGGMPSQLIGALTGLVQGHFPVAAPATYADDSVERLATRRITAGNAAEVIASDSAKGTSIYARRGAPVIAVNDGKIVKIGRSKRLGRYVELQDETGNVYTYANLGSVPRSYPVPKPVTITPAALSKQLSIPTAATPTTAASAGTQPASRVPSTLAATRSLERTVAHATGPLTVHSTGAGVAAGAASAAATAGALVKERLFANPSRQGSYAAGGAEQISTQAAVSSFQNYFSDILHLNRDQYTLAPLKAGAVVIAGTILGRVAPNTSRQASHLYFMIQPAGRNSPQIDPKPILDGWKLLEATAVYRADGQDPFFGPDAKNATVGQILLMSKTQLQDRIVRDPHLTLDACTIRDIQAGNIDRRILAAIEFLSASGLDPTATNPACETAGAGPDHAAETASGSTIDITRINNIPILRHQGQGSITDITIRRLLTLQSSMAPNQIISLMSYKGQPATLALPDHTNRIQIAYTPLYGTNPKLTTQLTNSLKPSQWIQLINRISQIPEPTIPTTPSKYAVKTGAR
jgi:hypothetical protein